MKPTTLLPALLALPWTLAQSQQVDTATAAADLTTSTLTMLDSSGSTLLATLTLVDSAAASPSPVTSRNTDAPTQSDPQPSITSILQATRTESRYITGASSSSNLNEDGIDVEAGASGPSSGGFSLSKGGMIAVIVVVVCVAVFGVLSITLFILAKKRQWRVRESIKRASRRLTGKPVGPRPRSEVDRRKRSGVIAGAGGQQSRRAPPSTPLVEQKRTAVSETEMTDLEKGEGGKRWLGKMRGNDWR